MPRSTWPRIVVFDQGRPPGPATPSRLRSRAVASGLLPDANSRKIRSTILASSGSMARAPAPSVLGVTR